jgi:hypothetical protein
MGQAIKLHRGIFAFAEQSTGATDEDEIVIPENLEEVTDEDLATLESRLVTAFDELRDSGDTTVDTVQSLTELADAVEAVRTENGRRVAAREEALAAITDLGSRIHASDEGEGEGEGEEEQAPEGESNEGEGDAAPEGAPAAPEAPADVAPQAVAAAAAPVRVPAAPRPRRINVPLSEIRARAPQADVADLVPVITAAADVPGVHAGARLMSLSQCAEAVAGRVNATPLTHAGIVAGPRAFSVAVPNTHTLSLDSSHEEVDRVLREILNIESMVAAGGWCAPSEILYTFFQIFGTDGILDLPTTGISRGGLKWPTSITLHDVFSNVWLWTEADDIDAVTGTGTKPCFRPACPSFDEERLDAHGICVTAGNLTDSAFPELIAHHIAVTMAAHVHVMNTREIANLVSGSTSVTVDSGQSADVSQQTAGPLLGATELQVWDYRNKYGMADSAILEAVYPSFVKGMIRSDLAKRNGVDLLSVTDAQILAWFDQRGVRVQFVQDWQVRASGQLGQTTPATTWPDTVSFALFAPGTWVRGQGPRIDLGVVRDSVLNETNDHTAAWTEEARLLMKRGHESRVITVEVAPTGVTAPQVAYTSVPA